jgi:hypothetical protein
MKDAYKHRDLVNKNLCASAVKKQMCNTRHIPWIRLRFIQADYETLSHKPG